MTKEHWEQRLPLIQDWIDGAKVQSYSPLFKQWIHCNNPIWSSNVEYRLEPDTRVQEALDDFWRAIDAIDPRTGKGAVKPDDLFETLGKTCRP